MSKIPTPILLGVLLGGDLESDDRANLEAEILSTLWVPLLSSRLLCSKGTHGTQISTSLPTDLRTIGSTLPMEIWLKIWALVKAPRILDITFSKLSNRWTIASDADRIPGALFVDRSARIETLKTHQVAFTGLFQKPILFNNQTDVLVFDEEASDTIPNTKNINSIGRNFKVRFVAFHFDPNLASNYVNRDPHVTRMLNIIRVFGSIEKVFMLPCGPIPSHIAWEATLRGSFLLKYQDIATIWASMERAGAAIASKWELPEIVILKQKHDILAML